MMTSFSGDAFYAFFIQKKMTTKKQSSVIVGLDEDVGDIFESLST